MDFSTSLPMWGWLVLHALGLVVAWTTRLTAGSRFDVLAQFGFFALLLCLSAVAWWSHQLEFGLWIPTGFTLAGMVLMAVVDLQPATRDDARHPANASRHLY